MDRIPGRHLFAFYVHRDCHDRASERNVELTRCASQPGNDPAGPPARARSSNSLTRFMALAVAAAVKEASVASWACFASKDKYDFKWTAAVGRANKEGAY